MAPQDKKRTPKKLNYPKRGNLLSMGDPLYRDRLASSGFERPALTDAEIEEDLAAMSGAGQKHAAEETDAKMADKSPSHGNNGDIDDTASDSGSTSLFVSELPTGTKKRSFTSLPDPYFVSCTTPTNSPDNNLTATNTTQPITASSSNNGTNSSTTPPTLNPPNTIPPVARGYAHELKKALSTHRAAAIITPRKRAPEHDPENYEIKRMRVEESMAWADIARILNDRRIANGQTPSLTEAAVYGRFVRNGPRIAAAHGEDFNPSDYMKLRNVKTMPEGETPPAGEAERFSAGQDAFLIEAHHEVQQGFWEAVADRLFEKSGKRFTAQQCAKRYQHL